MRGNTTNHLHLNSTGAGAIDGVLCPLGPVPIFVTATAPVPYRVNEPKWPSCFFFGTKRSPTLHVKKIPNIFEKCCTLHIRDISI